MIATRHEKISIAIASYVIGFVTAFIAFGVNSVDTGNTQDRFALANIEASEVSDYRFSHQNISSIGEDNLGLHVDIGGYKRIVSGNISALGASAIQSSGTVGFASKHHKATVSNDGWFAFYCDQMVEEDTTCLPFVYSLFDDTVHKVTLDGVQQPLSIENDTVLWNRENYLVISDFLSKDNVHPWKFMGPETAEEEGESVVDVKPEVQ